MRLICMVLQRMQLMQAGFWWNRRAGPHSCQPNRAAWPPGFMQPRSSSFAVDPKPNTSNLTLT